MYLNEVKLIGNLGNDAKTITLQNDRMKVVFQMATQRSWKNKDGKYESRTEWHNIVVYSGLTKFAANLLKGERVLVNGELRTREYEKEIGEGKKKTTATFQITEIFADSIRRMDRRKDDDTDFEPENEPAE